MLSTNSNFDTYHAYSRKTPMYLMHFDGIPFDVCNHKPTSPDNSLVQHLKSISGLSQTVTPEEGKASISGVKIEIIDYNNAVTDALASDTYNFHRKKVTVKAGYAGMAEADMLTIFVGYITGLDLSSDGLVYIFDVTDPKKWFQRKIFRGAETTTVYLSGNPINILLGILTSTGAETNGDYDYYASGTGLGIDDSEINISNIEAVRDDWFPGDSNYMSFEINKRETAMSFLENEIFKPLNIYPIIDGDGKFNIQPFKPPLLTENAIIGFDEDTIIGMPKYMGNFEGMFNEVEFFYDFDLASDEFQSELYYIDSTSLNNRGPGKKPITIKSKGWHSDLTPKSIPDRVTDNITLRKNKIFSRFATPPTKIKFKSFFSRWILEAGDIVPFTHSKIPDIIAGTRGYSSQHMEILSRSIDWKSGTVDVDLMDTGFSQDTFIMLSPKMTVVTGTSTTVFDVSAADALKFQEGWKIDMYDEGMRVQDTNLTITDITGTQITVSPAMSATPEAGWVAQFPAEANLTTTQALYWTIKTANSHAIVP